MKTLRETWYRLLTMLPSRFQTLSPDEALRGQFRAAQDRAGASPAPRAAAPVTVSAPAPVTPPAPVSAPHSAFSVGVQWGAAQQITFGQGDPVPARSAVPQTPRLQAVPVQAVPVQAARPAPARPVSVPQQEMHLPSTATPPSDDHDHAWEAPDSGPQWYGEPPEATPVPLAAPSVPADWGQWEALDDATLAAYDNNAESSAEAFEPPSAPQVPAVGQDLSREYLRERGHQAIRSGVSQSRTALMN
ncbi:hypothetical protein [Deinococcus saxicola]|uniref:hypothetical protein n=1 Tax=Deinococcus saxicola TaxID=249406 RepID=UPI0039EE6C35